ncbi:hypothetical protein SKAU_G00307380 [Synaphobranchus kaupii]|uniref:UPAR/Ly6 domain-containing protein n=1 Tax=Synaphobranchus kaupii TaxID=118154 RepID=A0A9Q1ER52_SYNKA|nr:hypothetical protein SKAU_G00307380 [Synaphobranchus kaupii]
MKLLVTLALACALFSKVYPLECKECILGTCLQPTTKPCPASQTKCTSATIELYLGPTQTKLSVKSCAAPAECVNGSLNIGITRTSINTQCCDSNFCNDQLPPALPDTSPNGKKCFTCLGDDCTLTLECIGTEDHCVKSTVSAQGREVTVKGCGSQTVCLGSLNSQLKEADLAIDLICCEGDMCNNALRIRQSILFLLLVPLAPFILFN